MLSARGRLGLPWQQVIWKLEPVNSSIRSLTPSHCAYSMHMYIDHLLSDAQWA